MINCIILSCSLVFICIYTIEKITRTYKDTRYNIEVKKGKKEELKLDGKSQINNYIKLENDSKNHEIKLTIK